MSYYATIDGVTYDNLIGCNDPPPLFRNIKASVPVTRGMLVAGSGVGSDQTVSPVTASDTDSTLYIASEDFVPTARKSTTTVFTRGVFNRSAIVVNSGLDIADFEEQMRKDNLILTDYTSKGGDT